MKIPLIVGIDPGVTTAIAILDVNGNVINLHSKRDMKRNEIINHIIKFGYPIIVSSDVDIAPKSVEKIAVKLGCVLYSPDNELTFAKKKNLTKEYAELTKNHHEVDALSASLKAWKHYRSLFAKVDDFLRRTNRQEIFTEIVSKLIKHASPNIEIAIRETESRLV